jgi:hypothetical protein
MKSLYKSLAIAVAAIMVLSGCKKDKYQLDTDVNAVTELTAPANGTSLTLQSGGANIIFQWQATTTVMPVLYEVAFDKSSGDFSHPIYKILSDGSGVNTQATISQDTLNKVASLAGIASSSSGTLKWAVIVSLAYNAKVSTQTFTLNLTRPAGFAVLPAAMYITGSSTESGTDVTKAIQMKQIANGKFESYTSLAPGSYQFSDQSNANGTKYYIDANGVLQMGNSTTTVSGTKAAYRLTLDFTVATTNVVRIDSIGCYMSAYNVSIGTLSYIGNGTWENPKVPVTFYQFSWGRDQRYKFILHTANGDEWWGSTIENNLDPSGQPASYFYLVPCDNTQWDYTYKFPAAADTHNVKLDMYFQASGPYTHTATAFN